ncbi:hypothetical protein Btru_047638 [Bulinus truncatus]|nr:hypothetical protein Btru_047638 [Bulinus truncatus]
MVSVGAVDLWGLWVQWTYGVCGSSGPMVYVGAVDLWCMCEQWTYGVCECSGPMVYVGAVDLWCMWVQWTYGVCGSSGPMVYVGAVDLWCMWEQWTYGVCWSSGPMVYVGAVDLWCMWEQWTYGVCGSSGPMVYVGAVDLWCMWEQWTYGVFGSSEPMGSVGAVDLWYHVADDGMGCLFDYIQRSITLQPQNCPDRKCNKLCSKTMCRRQQGIVQILSSDTRQMAEKFTQCKWNLSRNQRDFPEQYMTSSAKNFLAPAANPGVASRGESATPGTCHQGINSADPLILSERRWTRGRGVTAVRPTEICALKHGARCQNFIRASGKPADTSFHHDVYLLEHWSPGSESVAAGSLQSTSSPLLSPLYIILSQRSDTSKCRSSDSSSNTGNDQDNFSELLP